MHPMKTAQRDQQRGSALVYILIAVALLAALTISFMEPSSQQATSQNSTNLVSDIRNQISFINSAIQECVLGFPDQDSGLLSTTNVQENAPFPINPADPYYTAESATPGVAANNNVENIRCPGNPGGTGSNNQNHTPLFGVSSGKFMPVPPPLMEPWEYYSGDDGVYIMIRSTRSDAYIDGAFAKINDQFSLCEVDTYNRTGTTAVNITSDTMPTGGAVRTCPAGNKCLRFWILIKSTASSIHADGAPC